MTDVRAETSGVDQIPEEWASMSPAELVDHLERDTHLHIHKENNVLFPAVVASSS